VQYQVDSAANVNLRQLDLDKSIAYGLQHRASANLYAANAGAEDDRIASDAHYYNDVMLDGKWRLMVNPQPKDLPVFEKPHLPTWSDGGDKKCGVQVEGGAFFDGTDWWTPNLPVFHPELRETRYIDVFAQGDIETTWTATATAPINTFRQASLDIAKTTPAPWIRLSRTSGRFSPSDRHLEDRIQVSIDWAAAPAGAAGEVVFTGPAFLQPIAVHVLLAPPQGAKDVSFIEDGRIVSIYATHADALSAGWEVLDGLGHTGAALRSRLDMQSVDAASDAEIRKAPSAVYRFATSTANDRATLNAVALPTFPITSENGVRIAVSIDGGPLHVLDFLAPEFSEAWRQHVLTNKAVEKLADLRLAPGAHTLTVYALDPGVTLDRFEITFTGAPRAYGPVPETRIGR
jgi:Gylcosyl hydrolase family 115 C-terminal domain